MDARWWRREGDLVVCGLCFRGCRLEEGAAGACGARTVRGGELISPWLGRFCARAVDPIEKKPLAQWRPGSMIFSLGSFGCTMDCPFCQNHPIARPAPGALPSPEDVPFLSPERLVREIMGLGLHAVAFTYNEPTLQAEHILAAAPLLRRAGVAIVLVTNGAMSMDVALELMPWIDAVNVDVKAFTSEGYRRLSGDLQAVENVIEAWARGHAEGRGPHVELTHLVVPGLCDDLDAFSDMIDWIASVSPQIPLHVTRCFPARDHLAPPTDAALLRSRVDIARRRLRHVYLGNV